MRAPAPVPGTGAPTSRPAGPDTVTGCRPAVEIPNLSGQEIQQAVARAAFAARLGAAREQHAIRTLEQLRASYPGWHIERRRDDAGREWWVAVLLAAITPEMHEAGVVGTVQKQDGGTLADSLAWQSSLLRNMPSPAAESGGTR